MRTETCDKHRSGASNVIINLNIWEIIKMPKIYPKLFGCKMPKINMKLQVANITRTLGTKTACNPQSIA